MPCRLGRVHDVLTEVDRAGRDEHLDDAVERSSGTVSRSRSAALATAVGLSIQAPGSSVSIRLSAADTPDARPMRWRSGSAVVRTAPTRAPMTPMDKPRACARMSAD